MVSRRFRPVLTLSGEDLAWLPFATGSGSCLPSARQVTMAKCTFADGIVIMRLLSSKF